MHLPNGLGSREVYLLDANVLINAKNTWYSFELVPGFWNWVMREAEQGRLFSIIQVRTELRRVDDQLSRWTRELPDSFWLRDNTPGVTQALGELAKWASDPSRQYRATAIQTFLGSADYYLAAQGKATGHTVVTNETSAPRRGTSIKLPDACNAVSVQVITALDWIRKEATRFEGFGS